ncbi:LapA family protein [bacterium]|nr:LapA family protein [bacterium]
MKIFKKLFLMLVFLAIAFVISYFAHSNEKYVTIDFLIFKVNEIQVWLLSIFCFIAGMIAMILFVAVDVIRNSRHSRKLEAENAKLKAELASIRSEKLSDIDEKTLVVDEPQDIRNGEA